MCTSAVGNAPYNESDVWHSHVSCPAPDTSCHQFKGEMPCRKQHFYKSVSGFLNHNIKDTLYSPATSVQMPVFVFLGNTQILLRQETSNEGKVLQDSFHKHEEYQSISMKKKAKNWEETIRGRDGKEGGGREGAAPLSTSSHKLEESTPPPYCQKVVSVLVSFFWERVQSEWQASTFVVVLGTLTHYIHQTLKPCRIPWSVGIWWQPPDPKCDIQGKETPTG